MAGGVRRACTAVAVVLGFLAVGGAPAGALEPSLTDLGEGFTPVGINSSGVVVGTRTAGPSAGPATWAGGTFTSLGLPGGANAGTVADIADDGRVIGSAFFELDQVLANAEQAGDDVVLTFQNGTITFHNTQASTITSSDFIIG